MQKFTLKPSSITSNVICGEVSVLDDLTANVTINLISLPKGDMVYKACVCKINTYDKPENLGAVFINSASVNASFRLPYTDGAAIIIYIKDTKSGETFAEAYAILENDNEQNVKIIPSYEGMFTLLCELAKDDDFESDKALASARDIVEDYRMSHQASGETFEINKKYFSKIKSELAKFDKLESVNDGFSWHKIDFFTTIVNLSAIKFALFDTLPINAFDTAGYYLFGVKKEIGECVIALALKSDINPFLHLDGLTKEMELNGEKYHAVFIELAPDGQYFIA